VRSALPIATGDLSRRLHGARLQLQQRRASALEASRTEGASPEFAAAMRGKACGLKEAEAVIAAIETGRPIPKRPARRRFWRAAA